MKLDVETALNQPSFSIPRNFTPDLIVDLGNRTKFSTFEYATRFPEAKILSFSMDKSNFLADHHALTYHDKVIFRYLLTDGELDKQIYREIPFEQQIDFIKFDIDGKEKRFIKDGGRWAVNTKYLKARLTNYDYSEAKSDLRRLGFYSAAMHDGHSYYVVGERID